MIKDSEEQIWVATREGLAVFKNTSQPNRYKIFKENWNVTDCKICFEYGLYYSPVSTPADFRSLAPIVSVSYTHLAGLEEMPCIVREMTDLEAVREMRNSNKQRGGPLPSELAKLLDLELEAIKRQGARPKNDKEAEALGKLSVEIVGKEHDMNYKKVLRYVRLNHLVPELLEKVDAKNMGFMPAVELSYIKPENQRLIAVSIDGEVASPSVKQAKRLRELDQEGLLNGDVIDGILSEEKREVDNVIISTDELNKYFGKEVTPAKMKAQILALLDEWKEKQPPELAKPEKKNELDK